MIPGAILRYKITTRLSAYHISYYSSDMKLVYCNKDSTSSIVTTLETQLDQASSTRRNFPEKYIIGIVSILQWTLLRGSLEPRSVYP